MAKAPSSYELKVVQILRAEGIHFIKEKAFKDWRKLYKYDFYIPNYKGQPILIEVDGQAHFKRIPFFHKRERDFMAQQERDRRKNNYALAHNIPLYRIPYWEMEKISAFKDIINNPKFLVKSSWHTDLLEIPKDC